MFVFYLKLIVKRIIFCYKLILNKDFFEYHHFPFNNIKVRLKDEDAVELHNICNMLDSCGFTYRLTDGLALGFYREHHFIRHDNDLDFDLKDFNSLSELKKAMRNRGYKVGREAYYLGKVQQIVFYNKNQLLVDFLVWYKEGDVIKNYEEEGYVRTQDPKHFDTLTNFDCYGYTFKLPGDMEEWLVKRYGEDWRIPKTYKGDWKDECLDLEKL